MLWAPFRAEVVTVVVDDKESGKRLNIGIATTDPDAIMSLLAHAAGKSGSGEAEETPTDGLPEATGARTDEASGGATSGESKASNMVTL
jgi:hypothetical protein